MALDLGEDGENVLSQFVDGILRRHKSGAITLIDARAKGQFKNWDDFVARKVVPANAQRAIKDLVLF